MSSVSLNASLYPKLFGTFITGLVIATIGCLVGSVVPYVLMIPLMICELILVFTMGFLRKRKRVGFAMMSVFLFISGLTTFPVISYYVGTIGAVAVAKAFAVTVIAFSGTAFYAVKSKADFRYLHAFLFSSLIGLIGIGVVNIFVPFNHTLDIVYSAFGVLIFIGYTLYDFSKLTHERLSENDIPFVVVSIYLDFINLFLFILRLFGVNVGRD